jgi:uncharacterized protein (DUF488 family)
MMLAMHTEAGRDELELSEEVRLYTIGYEGRVVENFVEDLSRAGVEVLVDVREMPVSRKPGFSKTKLSRYVANEGIDYLHLKSLGSPRDSRRRLRESGDFDTFSREYVNHLEGSTDDLGALLALISSGRQAAIMCFERDHAWCHRTLLVRKPLLWQY